MQRVVQLIQIHLNRNPIIDYSLIHWTGEDYCRSTSEELGGILAAAIFDKITC